SATHPRPDPVHIAGYQCPAEGPQASSKEPDQRHERIDQVLVAEASTGDRMRPSWVTVDPRTVSDWSRKVTSTLPSRVKFTESPVAADTYSKRPPSSFSARKMARSYGYLSKTAV